MWRSTANTNMEGAAGIQRSISTHLPMVSSDNSSSHQYHHAQHHINPHHAGDARWQQLQRDHYVGNSNAATPDVVDSKISLHINYRNETNNQAQQQQLQRPRPVSMYEQFRSRNGQANNNHLNGHESAGIGIARHESLYFVNHNNNNNNNNHHKPLTSSNSANNMRHKIAATNSNSNGAVKQQHPARQSPSEMVCKLLIQG